MQFNLLLPKLSKSTEPGTCGSAGLLVSCWTGFTEGLTGPEVCGLGKAQFGSCDKPW